MTPFSKNALFVLLGIALGAGGAALAILPDANALHLADEQRLQRFQEANDSNAAALTNCNRELVQRHTSMKDDGIGTIYNATAGTVIYEPTSRQFDVNVSLRLLRGLGPLTMPSFKVGGGHLVPHWIIPGRVEPVFVGDAQGAVYYFFQSNLWTGPITPQPVPQQ